jgi:hypothetical protein
MELPDSTRNESTVIENLLQCNFNTTKYGEKEDGHDSYLPGLLEGRGGHSISYHMFAYARTLWLAMREVWELSPDDMLIPSSKEWLLHFLASLSETQRAMILMTSWRVCHVQNKISHGKPCPSIGGSKSFLVDYLNSLLMIKQYPEKDVIKGKMILFSRKGFKL